MFTFRTNSPELTKAVKDGFEAVVTELKISNELRAREVKVQEELLGLLRRQCRPARPTGLTHQLVKETQTMAADILTYKVTADAPTDPDVESRKLKLEVDGAVTKEATVGSEVIDFGTIEVPQNSQVKLSIIDVDDGGLESPPLVAEFQALDTIAPTTPTGLNLTLVGERENPDAPPPEENPDPVTPTDPPAEQPPAEEPPAPPAE